MKRTMGFQSCDPLRVVCGGRRPVQPLPTIDARSFTSRRGLGRHSNHFLGSMIPVAPRPFKFWVAETLVPVATISFSGKQRVPCYFPPVSQSLMVVVSRLDDPILSCVPWPRGCSMARRLARGSTLLVPVAFSSGRGNT